MLKGSKTTTLKESKNTSKSYIFAYKKTKNIVSGCVVRSEHPIDIS